MIPTRYLIATLFIAGLLLLLAIVQSPRLTQGPRAPVEGPAMSVAPGDYEILAEFPMEDGWAPRFQGAQDPDQHEAWPFEGGFGTPWEPASPYLGAQGLALNGPGGRSMVALWRGLEWRRYRFDVPLVSARLMGHRLLVTLQVGPGRFETRLIEIPEGRVLWATDSGPWSRFSWDGEAVLVGERVSTPEGGLLFSLLPVSGDPPEPVIAQWDRPDLGFVSPRKGPYALEDLFEEGRDYRGALLLAPLTPDLRVWVPGRDRLWVCASGQWASWTRDKGWTLERAGRGVLNAMPPKFMGCVVPSDSEGAQRQLSPVDREAFEPLPPDAESWPAPDPAWVWPDAASATTAWDVRRGPGLADWPPEHQREALVKAFRADWRSASKLRASVPGWLPIGPEVALREAWEVAWVWVGNRALMVRLHPSTRCRRLRSLLQPK